MKKFLLKVIKKFLKLYYLGVELRNQIIKLTLQKSYPLFIVSVGNIQIGGTGKTPFIKYLINELLQHNIKKEDIVLISRGYRRKGNGELIISKYIKDARNFSLEELGDENYMLYKQFKIEFLIGKNRRKNIEDYISILKENSIDLKNKIIILDDGFQHLYIKREIDILIFNLSRADSLFYREELFAIRRADIVLLTKYSYLKNTTRYLEYIKKLNTNIFFSEERYLFFKYEKKDLLKVKIQSIYGKKAILIAAIGDVSYLKNILKDKFKIVIIKDFVYRDHYNYTEKDIEKIEKFLNLINDDFIIITTMKDFYKLEEIITDNMKKDFYVIDYLIENKEVFNIVFKRFLDYKNGRV